MIEFTRHPNRLLALFGCGSYACKTHPDETVQTEPWVECFACYREGMIHQAEALARQKLAEREERIKEIAEGIRLALDEHSATSTIAQAK